jgi:hypothetical protein
LEANEPGRRVRYTRLKDGDKRMGEIPPQYVDWDEEDEE